MRLPIGDNPVLKWGLQRDLMKFHWLEMSFNYNW